MNQEEKTHWTQDKILLYVKACMSATGLIRMPSRSELSEYYGNDKLTNAIRRFPGGYYKIAEILNVEMKESETQFGKYGEDLATKLWKNMDLRLSECQLDTPMTFMLMEALRLM